MDRYDVIIVGTGAGGATLAHRLAPTGKRILLLERGTFLPRERENWSERAINEGRYRARERWLDDEGRAVQPFTHFWVGGNTKLYGAALLRMREDDFAELAHYDGISPAWPLRYADFEPYYTQAERLYHVHGEAGAHEPPRSAPFPYPALAHERRIAQLERALRAQGLSPSALPVGVRLPQDRAGERAPVLLSAFDGFPDPTETKADAHVIGIASALRHSNVALRTGALVERVIASTSGREVTGVMVDGELLRADVVVVACGAIMSSALLLRSACSSHPRGLANGSDQLGRNLMLHNNGACIALGAIENDARFQKTLALFDWYRRSDGPPLGSVQLMGRSDLVSLRALFPGEADATLRAHTTDFWLTSEDLPRPENRVRLSPDGSVQLSYTRTNARAYRELQSRLEQALRAAEPDADHRFAGYQLDISGVSHQCGTARFGSDPRSSVLDLNCKAHELDNLYVVDASFFCSSAAVNPSLTIIANALRVGDHLAARLS